MYCWTAHPEGLYFSAPAAACRDMRRPRAVMAKYGEAQMPKYSSCADLHGLVVLAIKNSETINRSHDIKYSARLQRRQCGRKRSALSIYQSLRVLIVHWMEEIMHRERVAKRLLSGFVGGEADQIARIVRSPAALIGQPGDFDVPLPYTCGHQMVRPHPAGLELAFDH